MPQPRTMDASSAADAFRLSGNWQVSLTHTDSPRLKAAVARTLKRISDETRLPAGTVYGQKDGANLIVDVASDGGAVQGVDEDESYQLKISASSIQLIAPTTVGALHGLETLVQLVQHSGTKYSVPSVSIEDAPRFRWRGLMIDCGRHFVSMDVLKRNIDAMAAVKLNVFHWHLTEDQGFRIESKRFPKLTEIGANGQFYTQEEARGLVRYARERGIRVVPEFEMPGHSTAWLVAYPELASGTVPNEIRREFGVSDYAIDPTREETYRFIESFLAEMVQIFPDQYIHIGGDETPAPDWKTNPRIQAFMQAHKLKGNEELQAYFNQRILAILTKLNRRMVGWDEIFNPALPKDVVVQSWRGAASLAAGAQQGYQGILSAPYYLDGMKSAGDHYLADPVPVDTKLSPQEQKLILGGEICMWTEHVNSNTIDSRIWPRTAAIAERLWSPQQVKDVSDMYRRLEPVSLELETLGVRHLSYEDVALRNLSGTENIEPLRTFAIAVEPASFSQRAGQQHTNALTPLTNFVDAVRPDPQVRYELQSAATAFLADPAGHSEAGATAHDVLRGFFAAETQVPSAIEKTPRSADLADRIAELAQIAPIGVQAVDALRLGTSMSAEWKQNASAAIERAKQPSAIIRFDFLEPLSQLVAALP